MATKPVRLLTRAAVLLALAAGLLVSSAPVSAGTPSPPAPAGARQPEHVLAGPPPRMRMGDQMPAAKLAVKRSAAGAIVAPAGVTAGPFLTRPYWGYHYDTSVFDHCNPDYSRDGRICEFDGTVATSGNGVDPTFAAGYALTYRGSDYLYYDGHNGWDIALNYETLIAAAPGVVNLAGGDPYNSGFGLTVTIDHPGGLTTRYAHMSQISVQPGQAVNRGQVIGTSGNTGASTGPHLHFGVYTTNPWNAIDPWGWTGSSPDPWPYDVGNLWFTGNPQNPVPWAPGAVTARAGDASAALSWTPPSFTGGEPISSYRVAASPGGRSVTVAGSATSAVFTGLSNFTAYSFTVTATNGIGQSGPPSSASNSITPTPQLPGRYNSLAPARVLDTRDGTGGLPPLGPGATATLSLAGVAGLPASGVDSVLLNVTVTDATDTSYLTVVPTGADPTQISNLNFGPGQVVANLVGAAVGSDGRVAIYNSRGTVNVIADLFGWVGHDGSTGAAGRLQTVTPARILDTRMPAQGGRVGPGTTVSLQTTGRGGLPASGVSAVVLNLTATNPSDLSYLSAWAAEGARPTTSNLNFGPGQTVANRAVVPVGPSGRVSLYNSAGSSDVLVDVAGYYTDGSAAASAGLYTAVKPARLLDTRLGSAPVQVGERVWIAVPVAGQGGLPASGVGAVLVNVTATNSAASSYLAVEPSQQLTATSDLNFGPGQTVANLALARVGADGRIWIYNAAGSTDVLVDVFGWY